jgi:hypothetical protein
VTPILLAAIDRAITDTQIDMHIYVCMFVCFSQHPL